MSDEKEKLKRRVMEFVKAQPGYDEVWHVLFTFWGMVLV